LLLPAAYLSGFQQLFLKEHGQNSQLRICRCDEISKEIFAERCHMQVVLDRERFGEKKKKKTKKICSCKDMSVQKEAVTFSFLCRQTSSDFINGENNFPSTLSL